MKPLKLFLLLCFIAKLAGAQSVKFSTENPVAGTTVKFTYDPKGTNLQNLADVKCTSLSFFSTTNPKSAKVDLVKEGDIYKGEIVTSDSITLAALAFSVDEQKDESPNGYMLKFTKDGKIPAEAYLNEAFLFGLAGKFYLGLTLDYAKSAASYKQAFAIKPALEKKYLVNYLSNVYKANKETGALLIEENIKTLSKINDPKEEDLVTNLNLYNILKKKAQADSVKAIVLKKFSTGNYAYGQAMNALYAEKDPPTLEQKANDLITKFKLDKANKADAAKLNSVYALVAEAFASVKNDAKFELYANKVDAKTTRAGLYNQLAWPLAEKNENIAFATKISKQSLDLIELAKNDEKPAFYQTKEDYIKALDQSWGMYADTYALLLYHDGKFKEALATQEKAVSYYKVIPPDVNTRYITYLIKDGKNEKAFTEAEKLIREGKGSDSLKKDFKMLYANLKKAGSYETFMADLEKEANAKAKAEWTKKMINIPAPTFSLANLKGEKVSLSDLKGKIVILDYWATWCGPCVASFPGMQKAMAKYANNPNVVFLYVNTWQTEENREKVVTDFIAEKKLNFNVLYDTKNVKDPSKFDIVSAYKVEGIPTKFIIDGDGNIRFKAVGFSGSDDGVVKEIDSMIGLLTSKEASK